MAQSTVRSRIDLLYNEVGSLDGLVQEVSYRNMQISGWNCYISAGGINLCILDLDLTNCIWEDSSAFSGSKLLTGGISENLPNAVFKLSPTISVTAYKTSSDFSFICCAKLPTSNIYIGNYDIYAVNKSSTTVEYPTDIHVVITAIGF